MERLSPEPTTILRTHERRRSIAVPSISIKLEMNFSGQSSAWRERKRVKLEIGVAETTMTKSGAQCDDEENYANRAKTKNQENARIIAAGKLRDESDRYGYHHQIAEDANHPGGNFGFLALAFRFAVGPILPPQATGRKDSLLRSQPVSSNDGNRQMPRATNPAPIAEIKRAMAAPATVPLVPGLWLFARNVNRESSPGTRNINPKQIKNAAAPLEGLVTQQF